MGELDWTKECTRCGDMVQRWRGQTISTCDGCGADYNPGGQRLVDDWDMNPSIYDDDISDLDGYEMQHAGDE